jgi:hypothetical protein
MPISSVNDNQLYYNQLIGNNKNEAFESAGALLGASGGTSAKNAYSAYGANMYSGVGQNAMQRAIDELKQKNGGAVTFGMVKDYREELEKDFKTMIMGGLALLGFEETDEFRMIATPEGEIEILSDDEEVKAAMAFLLEESPKLKEQFLYLQALGNIERAKGAVSAQMQSRYAQAGLGSEAMDILLSSGNFLGQAGGLGVGYSALMANYSMSDIQYTLGANYLV